MPRVPRYEGPEIRSTAMPAARISPVDDAEAYGAGASAKATTAAFQGVGETALKIMKQQRNNADDLAVLEARAKALTVKTDADVMIAKSLGTDSLTAADRAIKYYDAETKKIASGLQTGRQQSKFNETMITDKANIYNKGKMWAVQQMTELDRNTTASYVKNAEDYGSKQWSDPEQNELHLNNARLSTAEFGKRIGLTNEMIKENDALIVSSYRAATVKRMIIDDNVEGALEYEKKYIKEIREPDEDSIRLVKSEYAKFKEGQISEARSTYLADTTVDAKTNEMNYKVYQKIDKTTYDLKASMLKQNYNSDDYTAVQKFEGLKEFTKRWNALDGGIKNDYVLNEFTKKWEFKPDDISEGAPKEPIIDLLLWLSENKGLFTEELFLQALQKTQKNLAYTGPRNADLPAKKTFYNAILDFYEGFRGKPNVGDVEQAPSPNVFKIPPVAF